MRSKPATKADRRRMGIVKECGCVVCGSAPCQAHHLLSGGVRRGHRYTVGLCEQHHWQVHNEKFAFYEAWNTSDEKMLADTDRLVAEFEAGIIR